MYKTATPLFLLCETPLHAGSGSDLGIVDLPIQRERHTDFPKIESSSLKGSIRESYESKINSKSFATIDSDDTKIHRVFGYDDGSLSKDEKKALENCFKNSRKELQKDFAGAVGFSDARLLLFPVKSMKGVFAWITCPKALGQFKSDLVYAGKTKESEKIEPFLGIEDIAVTCSGSKIKFDTKNKIVLEEYAFDCDDSTELTDMAAWLSKTVFGDLPDYWKNKVKTDIVVLPDNDFKDFVNLSTEVITRTKINNVTGTVAKGALFTEEYLPAESLMYSLVLTAPEFRAENPMTEDKVRGFIETNLPPVIQLGGNATLGKGIIRTKLLKSN
jgi:CRISPR-associated protein Cmr4